MDWNSWFNMFQGVLFRTTPSCEGTPSQEHGNSCRGHVQWRPTQCLLKAWSTLSVTFGFPWWTAFEESAQLAQNAASRVVRGMPHTMMH